VGRPHHGADVLGLVALLAVLVGTSSCTSKTAPERPAAPPMPIVRTPTTWHIEYRLEEPGGNVSTDKVWVRRPFDSRLETWTGPPPGTAKVVEEIATFARRTNGELTLQLPPGLAAADARVDAVRAAAVKAGVLVPGATKTVVGRRCQVLRSRVLLTAAVLQRPTAKDYADSCVDEAGLVLEDVLVSGGKQLQRRIAVSVEEDRPVGDDLFPVKQQSLDVRSGGGSVRALADGSRAPGEFFELPSVPAGFVRMGRYSAVPPQPENFSAQDPLGEARRRASVVDVWTRGPDLLLVDQGATLGGAPAFAPDASAPQVDLGPVLGKGEVVLSAVNPGVRVALAGGRYVRVAGTLPTGDLAALARQLQKVEGTPLTFKD
jgi:hypothetical protein